MTYLEMAEKYGWEGSNKLKKAKAEGKLKPLKYGGAMAPNIPTWDYPSKGAFVRDTTDAPPRKYNKGGYLERIKRMAASAKKFNNGGGTDDPPYSAYNVWKNQTQPYDKFGFANPDYNIGNRFDFRTNNFRNYNPLTNLDLKIEIPQNPPTDYIFDSYGWDYKKEYGEDGTPHYYRSKAGTDKWEDLHTVKGNALAAVKALEFGDDMSYIGTDAHKKQRQYYFEEGLKDKGEWFGPIDEAERKKLIQSWYDPENKGADFMGSGEAPNIILTWAQDKDFISRYYKHFIRNYGEENENSNLFKQLLSGKFGYNPSTKTIYRLDKMGDAGKSRAMDRDWETV